MKILHKHAFKGRITAAVLQHAIESARDTYPDWELYEVENVRAEDGTILLTFDAIAKNERKTLNENGR